jgi:hypothetical protein
MDGSALNHKPDTRMLLCTTEGRGKRAFAHTHTHTHTNRCGDDWFEGFIPDFQSHEVGRKEGTVAVQKHLLDVLRTVQRQEQHYDSLALEGPSCLNHIYGTV